MNGGKQNENENDDVRFCAVRSLLFLCVSFEGGNEDLETGL